MKFDPPLRCARLVRRYKRFLADMRLSDGTALTLHCPNTGSMRQCLQPDSWCWFSTSANPRRKYPYTWEIATTPLGDLAGINTARSNGLVLEAIQSGVITELQGYSQRRCEVPYGREGSRIDILLEQPNRRETACYVEVKNVTLREPQVDGTPPCSDSQALYPPPHRGLFPDAVSVRGSKHLRELMAVRRQGYRAVLLYCVQHTGIEWVQPAETIDPLYAATFKQAVEAGVEVYAYRAEINPEVIALTRAIPVHCT